MYYAYSDEHSTDTPPAGVIRGTLFGESGQYSLQFRLVTSDAIFAGPKVVNIATDNALTEVPIIRCQSANPPSDLRTALLVAQYKKIDDLHFQEEPVQSVNYRCTV